MEGILYSKLVFIANETRNRVTLTLLLTTWSMVCYTEIDLSELIIQVRRVINLDNFTSLRFLISS